MVSKIKLFFLESYRELKRVNWPTFRQTARLTGVVIGMSIGVAIFLGVLDIGFVEAVRLILGS